MASAPGGPAAAQPRGPCSGCEAWFRRHPWWLGRTPRGSPRLRLAPAVLPRACGLCGATTHARAGLSGTAPPVTSARGGGRSAASDGGATREGTWGAAAPPAEAPGKLAPRSSGNGDSRRLPLDRAAGNLYERSARTGGLRGSYALGRVLVQLIDRLPGTGLSVRYWLSAHCVRRRSEAADTEIAVDRRPGGEVLGRCRSLK